MVSYNVAEDQFLAQGHLPRVQILRQCKEPVETVGNVQQHTFLPSCRRLVTSKEPLLARIPAAPIIALLKGADSHQSWRAPVRSLALGRASTTKLHTRPDGLPSGEYPLTGSLNQLAQHGLDGTLGRNPPQA